MNIILIGMMGSAKSSVGRIVAAKMRRQHLDLDNIIEEQCGLDIPTIFARFGEPHFRFLEAGAMFEVGKFPLPAIISLGGGAILNANAMEALKLTGKVVYLEASPEHLLNRLEKSAQKRPLLEGAPDRLLRLTAILTARRSRYEHYADLVIKTDAKESVDVAAEIIMWWGTFAPDL
ncbi:MAG: shikimate kinase [Peptococcaceae bacterium]|nr:shikimate kinase [Peptococcaceae bacterium]